MSYDMTFRGTLEYDSPDDIEEALDAVEEEGGFDTSAVTMDELVVSEDTIYVDVDASAPASMWFDTLGVLTTLASYATGGYIDATYDSGEEEEGVESVRIHAGGEEEELDGEAMDYVEDEEEM